MRTTFRAQQPYADLLFQCAREYECKSPTKPERFIEKMKTNQGSIAILSCTGLDDEGLERRNPIIVALGDSVTAGHFEGLFPSEPSEMALLVQQVAEAARKKSGFRALEVTDARECDIKIP